MKWIFFFFNLSAYITEFRGELNELCGFCVYLQSLLCVGIVVEFQKTAVEWINKSKAAFSP